jgi:hypothetical protein
MFQRLYIKEKEGKKKTGGGDKENSNTTKEFIC